MSRYKVSSDWSVTTYDREPVTWVEYNDDTGETTSHTMAIEVADIVDTKDGNRPYRNGAFRIVVDGKAIRRGKGGTVPFYGEMAWASANRLFDDESFKALRERAVL
jgi:hypothetical protein